jgi:hypothetical protein
LALAPFCRALVARLFCSLLLRAELNKTLPLPLKQKQSPTGNSDSVTPTKNCASRTLNKRVNYASSTKRFPHRRSNKLRNASTKFR